MRILFGILKIVTLAILSAGSATASEAPLCIPAGTTPPCVPATQNSRYVIDLGRYRGIFGMSPQSPQNGAVPQRFACPSTGRCLCELTTNADPIGDWFLVFSGRPSSDGVARVVPIKFNGGKLTIQQSFLGADVSLRGNKITLAPGAFRTAVFERDGKPATWGLEYWDCLKDAFARLPANGKLRVKLIRNVENNASAGPSLEALTASDDKTGFSAIPSFLETDPRHRRAVRLKRTP